MTINDWTQPTTLSCGHLSTPERWGSGGGIPGYATTPDGARICYSCATERAREALKTDDRYTAYLSSDGASLTTWTGGRLARVTSLTRCRHNIGGYLYRFRAVDVHGGHWYGTSPEQGMYARMRRSKNKGA